MSETKIELWKRKIRNGRRKQEKKQKEQVWNKLKTVKKKLSYEFDINVTPVQIPSRKLKAHQWTVTTEDAKEAIKEAGWYDDIAKQIDEELKSV